MKFEDIVALAKAGYSPKQVKEFLEYVETSPKVQEAPAPTAEDVKNIEVTPEPQPIVEKQEVKQETAEDILNRLLEE